MTFENYSSFPKANLTDDSIEIALRPGDKNRARDVTVRAVIDQGEFGELIGVEILNITDQIGHGAFSFWIDADRPFSYDEEADAFYVRIQTGRAPRQRSTDARLYLDDAGLFRVVVSRV